VWRYGTALTAVFHRPITTSADAAYEDVRQQYARTGRTLLPALGFDNTFAILVRGQDARSLGLKTLDDAERFAPGWRAGFGYEFLERPDGYPGLAIAYGLRFKGEPHVMDLSLSYRALSSRQVDLIAGDATAGLISASTSCNWRTAATISRRTPRRRSRVRRRFCAIRKYAGLSNILAERSLPRTCAV
jgi:glycine betaine/choline ABC-type transport system substrate-binding protein